jgi:hypothetical protein
MDTQISLLVVALLERPINILIVDALLGLIASRSAKSFKA